MQNKRFVDLRGEIISGELIKDYIDKLEAELVLIDFAQWAYLQAFQDTKEFEKNVTKLMPDIKIFSLPTKTIIRLRTE